MIEVTNWAGFVLSFDGRVVEEFQQQDSKRIHINHVKKVEVKEGRKGRLRMVVHAQFTMLTLDRIEPDQRTAIDDFVAQVTAACARESGA